MARQSFYVLQRVLDFFLIFYVLFHRAAQTIRWKCAGWIAIILLGLAAGAQGQGNGVFHEVVRNLSSSSLAGLTNDSSFIGNLPSSTYMIADYFEGPYNYDEHFGDRFRALIIPPVTGTYVFWVAGDDTGALFVSSDESAFNKMQVGYNTLTALFRAWYTYSSQQSTNIYLEDGRRYYIEALHNAGTGDDSLSVGWKLPDGTLELPIPALRLRPFGMAATTKPVFTSAPADITTRGVTTSAMTPIGIAPATGLGLK